MIGIYNLLGETNGAMPKTMGGRIKAALVEKEMSQRDLQRELARQGVNISPAQVSKLVNGHVTRPPTKTMQALKQILGVSLDYIIDSEEPEAEEKFFSPEANKIGAMIDAMSVENRQLMITIAEALVAADKRQNDSDVKVAQLLQENIKLLSNGQRAVADAHIERTAQNRRRLTFYQP